MKLDVLPSPNSVLEIQKPVKKTKKFLGTIHPHKGQFLWKLNLETMQITKVEYDQVNVKMNGEVHKKLEVEDGHLYALAINGKNAKRKFIKRLAERNVTLS